MVVLIVWAVAAVGFATWRWLWLARTGSSIEAHDRGLRELDAVARRFPTVVPRRRDPVPPAHVRVLPKETAVLRPAANKRRPRRTDPARRPRRRAS